MICARPVLVWPSFRKMLVILWFRRSEIYGIFMYDQSVLRGRGSSGGEFGGPYQVPGVLLRTPSTFLQELLQ